MSKNVISVEHITKHYDLGVIGTGTLSRDLNRWWARLRGQPDPYTRIGQRDHFERIGESILALEDVSFKVEQGEALGIIGKNGAGKSTLLKILSRVTAPTSGVVKVKGRIGSLLEVGTGFHPELTGRENVYLNGAILGMRKEEVDRKFDEIVDFSGVEKFIDTPVKRYSSGMYVRLAFSVAAHLDPEILVVDEVLAVGDVDFQKKCLGKMGDVAGKGRTVLFVSHNMAAVMMLCDNCLLLDQGKIIAKGKTSSVIQKYTNFTGTPENQINKNGAGEFFNVKYTPDTPSASSPLIITTDLLLNIRVSDYRLFLIIKDENSNSLVHSVISCQELSKELTKGTHHIKAKLPSLWLKPGNYGIYFKLVSMLGNRIRILSPVKLMDIVYFESNENLQGLINPDVKWNIENQ